MNRKDWRKGEQDVMLGCVSRPQRLYMLLLHSSDLCVCVFVGVRLLVCVWNCITEYHCT